MKGICWYFEWSYYGSFPKLILERTNFIWGFIDESVIKKDDEHNIGYRNCR